MAASQKGATFIEIMISVVILSILMIGFIAVFSRGSRTIREMGEWRIALLLAQQMLEEIGSKDYDDADSYDGRDFNPPQYCDGTPMDGTSYPPDHNFTPYYTYFRREVAVTNVKDDDFSDDSPADGDTDSKRITVTVSSTATPRHFEAVVLQTVVTDY